MTLEARQKREFIHRLNRFFAGNIRYSCPLHTVWGFPPGEESPYFVRNYALGCMGLVSNCYKTYITLHIAL